MTVLEVGPHTVRVLDGDPRSRVDPQLAEAALDWIDDPVGLFGERPVRVAEMWRLVMESAAGPRCSSMVLVHPDDWPPDRVGRVVAAANAVADEVVAVRRRDWDPAGIDRAPSEPVGEPPRRRRRTALAVWAVGVAVSVAVVLACVAVVVRRPPVPDPAPDPVAETQTVGEGRIEVRLPRSWSVTRVTGGPGSRRLQAVPPAGPDLAVHITQAYAPESTLAHAADVLGRVIADQPAGVFVDFRGDGQIAGRPAVTYREVRPGRVVDWSVVVVGSSRIGIGCQSPPGQAAAVQAVCLQAVTSARERGWAF